MVRKIVINAVALAVAAWLVPGIEVLGATPVDKALTLLVVALVFGLVNGLVRPVVKTASCLLVALTLGLFLWVVNALMLMLTSWIAGQIGAPFHVDGFLPAVLGSLVVSATAAVTGALWRDGRRGSRRGDARR